MLGAGDQPPLAIQLAHAIADLARARELVDGLRAQVSRREAGASSLTTAEWQLQQALQRVDRLRSQGDYYDGPEAA